MTNVTKNKIATNAKANKMINQQDNRKTKTL